MQPLALYIHWPFCKAKCPYCDFNSHVRESVDQAAWREALLAELAYMAARLPGRRLTSIFFGGGTPSLMPPETAGALIDAATRHWQAAPDIEITLEANPTSVEAAALEGFRAAGVNRVSLGVQSLKAESLAFLGRKHSAEEALAAVKLAARLFPRYSFDLIYALPGQSLAGWEAELREALAHAGGHLSLYQLTIEENTAFHHAHAKREFILPPDEHAAALYERTQEIMEAAGMPAYEVSNHASPGGESRHNLAYWRGWEYAGVGPGAHGRVRDSGFGGQGSVVPEARNLNPEPWIATQAIRSPERWLEAVSREGHGVEAWQALTPQERAEERLMTGLRLTEGMPLAEAGAINKAAYTRLIQGGFLEDMPGWLKPTLKGRLVLNALALALLAEPSPAPSPPPDYRN